jgi:peptidoglycan/LPS O-acetylase OafA/YrhL
MTKASPTAFLDGIRGFASLFVALYHFRLSLTNEVHIGYGTGGKRNVLQLPFIRLIFAGQSMVVIFFVVSGYALTVGSLRDIQNDNLAKFYERVRSSIFRRFFRLFLPTIASSFLACVCVFLGWYKVSDDPRYGYREPEPELFSNVFQQLWDWWLNTVQFLDVYKGERHLYYPNSWSIPVEFSCSMVLYLGLIAMAKLRMSLRMAGFVLFLAYCHHANAPWQWSFWIGASLCQLDQFFQVRKTENDEFSPIRSKQRNIVVACVWVVGAFLLSYPEWNGELSAIAENSS